MTILRLLLLKIIRKRTTHCLILLLTINTIATQRAFGQGFNKSASSWNTPLTLDQITDFSSGLKHTTMDINGDAKPDLVVTYDNGHLGSVGSFRWDVYLKSSSLSVENLTKHRLTVKSFPNPTNDLISVEVLDSPLQSVNIYNSFGQEIYKEVHLNTKEFSFDFKKFPTGIYYIQLESNKAYNTIKVLRK